MKKVYENPFAEIFDISDEIPNTIFVYWKNYLSLNSQGAVESCEFSLNYFKENNILVMISDHSHLEGAELSFLDWIHDYYFPTAVKNGLKSEIILDSTFVMGNISLNLMYDETDMYRAVGKNELYTLKIDTLENAKKLAQSIILRFKQ